MPRAYGAFQSAVTGDHFERWFIEAIGVAEGDTVLDIGCGPGNLLDSLPAVTYTGFDPNLACIEAARRRHGATASFHCATVASPPPLPAAAFDLVVARGVLHHLSDEEGASLFQLARRVLRPGGRVVTFDGCYVAGQNPIAKFLLQRDRGEFVRSVDGYLKLIQGTFDRVETEIFHDKLRIPYTHVLIHCKT